MTRTLGRRFGIRYYITACRRKKTLRIDPDARDLARASAADVLVFWARWQAWGERWRAKGYTVNGHAEGEGL